MGGCKWEGVSGGMRGRRRYQGQLPACTATIQLTSEMYKQQQASMGEMRVGGCKWKGVNGGTGVGKAAAGLHDHLSAGQGDVPTAEASGMCVNGGMRRKRL